MTNEQKPLIYPMTEAEARRAISALDGDLDRSLEVAWEIMHRGAWRSWMVRGIMRAHRGEVSALMRRLGPMIPGRSGRPRCLPPSQQKRLKKQQE